MALTLRNQRRLLRVLTLLLLAGVAGVGSLALSTGSPMTGTTEISPVDTDSKKTSLTEKPQRVNPKSAAWQTRLRRPLFDPPPTPPPKVVKKQLPPIRAKLLGTIIEPGASRAMIGLPGGKVKFFGKGDALGAQDPDAVITQIGSNSIKVARGDETTELTIDRGY